MQENTTNNGNEYGGLVGQFDGLEIGIKDIFEAMIPDILLNIQDPVVRCLMITLYFISISWLIALVGILFIICCIFSTIIEAIAKVFDKHE